MAKKFETLADIVDPVKRAAVAKLREQKNDAVLGAYRTARQAAVEGARKLGLGEEEIVNKYGVRGDWGNVRPNLAAPKAGDNSKKRSDVIAGDFVRLVEGARAGTVPPESIANYEILFMNKIRSLQANKKNRPVLNMFKSIVDDAGNTAKPGTAAAQAYMRTFLPAERAGIPREWVGRVMKSLPVNAEPQNMAAPVYDQFMRKLSLHLRDMTDAQRDAYLTALKRWSPKDLDSLYDLVLGSVR